MSDGTFSNIAANMVQVRDSNIILNCFLYLKMDTDSILLLNYSHHKYKHVNSRHLDRPMHFSDSEKILSVKQTSKLKSARLPICTL